MTPLAQIWFAWRTIPAGLRWWLAFIHAVTAIVLWLGAQAVVNNVHIGWGR